MYLSRIKLDRNDPGIRQCLRDGQDMHRSILKMFDSDRYSAGVLYRVSFESMMLYVLSSAVPKQAVNGMTITGTKEISTFENSISEQDIYDFDIVVSPSKKIKEPDSKNSKRRFLRTEEERGLWISRKAEQNGFSIGCLQEQKYQSLVCTHNSEHGGKMHCNAVRFTGTLTVKDKDKFVSAYNNGIGPGKSYGLGMLMLMNKR